MSPARADAHDRPTQIKRVLLGLLAANLAVVAAKFVIGAASGSLAVLSDGVHSSIDSINNVLGLAVIWVAARVIFRVTKVSPRRGDSWLNRIPLQAKRLYASR